MQFSNHLSGAIIYFLWNLAAFVLVWSDKHRARKGLWRVKERTFFLWAFCFGAAGILAGMYVFRHKTRRGSFLLGVPVLLIVNMACLYLVLK